MQREQRDLQPTPTVRNRADFLKLRLETARNDLSRWEQKPAEERLAAGMPDCYDFYSRLYLLKLGHSLVPTEYLNANPNAVLYGVYPQPMRYSWNPKCNCG
jgi:hypothetical protein